MKLSHWAKQNGISYLTAYRWFHSGKLPVKAIKTESGTILVDDASVYSEQKEQKEQNVVYCRVSNQSRKKEIEYQIKRCEDFCIAKGWIISKVYKEIASGMNDKRKEFWRMIDSRPTRIIVENKDRLTRFGFVYLKNLLKDRECEIVVIHESDTDEQDLLKDLVSVVTSFCCRIYGLRRAQNKIKAIKNIINDQDIKA